MIDMVGYTLLFLLACIIIFIWYCILSPDEMTSDQILWMEERGKQQMRDAGWSEDDIEKIHQD